MRRVRPGKPAGTSSQGEAGSVLMEGVLVLPLYLAMLGALFIAGELAHARQTLMAVERSITWLAADRFANHGTSGIMRMLERYVPKRDFHPPGGDIHVDELRRNGRVVGNTWLNGYAGYAVMDVQVPWWQGMANAEDAMYLRKPGDTSPWAFQDSYRVPEGGDGLADKRWRYFVVRRRGFDDFVSRKQYDAHYDRNASGLKLADHVESTVVNDPWIIGGEQAFHPVPAPKPPAGLGEYRRIPDLVGWGE